MNLELERPPDVNKMNTPQESPDERSKLIQAEIDRRFGNPMERKPPEQPSEAEILAAQKKARKEASRVPIPPEEVRSGEDPYGSGPYHADPAIDRYDEVTLDSRDQPKETTSKPINQESESFFKAMLGRAKRLFSGEN